MSLSSIPESLGIPPARRRRSGCSAKLHDDLLPPVRDLRSDVLEDEGLRLPVEHDLTARREEWEPLLNLALEAAAGVSRQGSISLGEAELFALVADEVQHRQDSLRRRTSKPTTELLEEDRCAFGGAEHEDGVDVGDVQALVQHIDGKHSIDAARAEVVRVSARSVAGVSPLIARAGIPASTNLRAMYSACATLTQNPSARMPPTSATLSRSS